MIKSYVDQRVQDLEFVEDTMVLFKVTPTKGVVTFVKRDSSSLWFIYPFEIHWLIGGVSYELALPSGLLEIHSLFHVSLLNKYNSDGSHVIGWYFVGFDQNLATEEEPITILHRQILKLRSKEKAHVMMQLKHHLLDKVS